MLHHELIVMTRMHSSRVHTTCSSSRRGGLHQAPQTRHHPPPSRHPPEQAPRRSRHPPEQASPWEQGPPGSRPPRSRHPPEQAPLPCGQTHTCKHITLPQTSFAGGRNVTTLLTNNTFTQKNPRSPRSCNYY